MISGMGMRTKYPRNSERQREELCVTNGSKMRVHMGLDNKMMRVGLLPVYRYGWVKEAFGKRCISMSERASER